MSYALGSDGYFTRDGRRFVPVGANYWPGSCGVEMWQAWPEAEMIRDLDRMRALGLNCVRFFIRWQDFEADRGFYDARQFERLRRFVGWCAERGIAAHPTLFVGFMSGGIFWPAWKAGRNLFADADMRLASAAFASQVSRELAPVREHILAIDQGNELCCLAESHQAPPAAIRAWSAAVSQAVKDALPGMTVISGNEQNQVVWDTGWRFDGQPGCDLLSMHGYPVTGWHAIAFDGMTDPLCQGLLPYYVRCARAFGPCFLQEFGTIATFGARQQDAYLRGMLPQAWASGANGFLWWCFADITADVHPYRKVGMESTLGLVDDAGAVKPGLEYFVQFARERADAPAPAPAADLALWWPAHYYEKDDPENPGNDAKNLSRRMVVADYLIKRLGRTPSVARSGCIPAGIRTLVIAGAFPTQPEWRELGAWVRAGGRLVIDGVGAMTLGRDANAVIGAAAADYRAATPCRTEAFGAVWETASFGQGLRLEVELHGAQAHAYDEHGRPSILVHQLGAGRVVTALAIHGDAIAAIADRPKDRDRWTAWYRGLLELAER